MAHRKLWTIEEDQVIKQLISFHGTNQWTIVAAQMKGIMPSTRSSKQIRQRWYNQLCPDISKTPWLPQQQTSLFEAHAEIGNRWKQIAKKLNGRTDNSVKNHFYSTIRRALRRMDKNFGFRDSTKKMRNLKPSALTYFLEVAHKMEIYSQMMQLIIQFAQWKPTRQNKKDYKQHAKQIYQKILQILGNYKQPQISAKQKRSNMVKHSSFIQNQSTQSDELSFEPQQNNEWKQNSQGEGFNYFGGNQFRSWFNMNDKEEELILDKAMGMPCDSDRDQ